MASTAQRSQDSVSMRATVLSKTWIWFDLDDTLHEFHKASGMATTKALDIVAHVYGIELSNLLARHKEVLAMKTSAAFVDGRSSHEYRRERFAAVLSTFSLPTNVVMQEVLCTYEQTLMQSLRLKEGVIDLLKDLKTRGKNIAIITEGPQDAQERTLEKLGLTTYVDFLATTNSFHTAKVDGLFKAVLQKLNVAAVDVAMIGDSETRDIIPAAREGIFCIHLDENETQQHKKWAKIQRISDLHPTIS